MSRLVLATAALLVLAAAPARALNVAGTWTSFMPSEHGGTEIAMTQPDGGIAWTGGPRDRAWVQDFSAALDGLRFSGTFHQDDPGREPKRYSGTISGHFVTSCTMILDSVVQQGQETLIEQRFDKQPCEFAPRPLRHVHLVLFKKRYSATDSPRSCPADNECVARAGATVRICNRDDYKHVPFSLSTENHHNADTHHPRFLRSGECVSYVLKNTSKATRKVIFYDQIHSQERFVILVRPRSQP